MMEGVEAEAEAGAGARGAGALSPHPGGESTCAHLEAFLSSAEGPPALLSVAQYAEASRPGGERR